MNKRKYILKLTIVFIVMLSIIYSFGCIALAHPGSLDSNGGHYNRTTGDYHYHAGINDGSNSMLFTFIGLQFVAFVVWIIWLSISSKKEEKLRIQRQIEEKRMLEEEQRKRCEQLKKEKEARIQREIEEKRIFEEERKKYYEIYANKDILKLCRCPEGTYIGDEGLPTTNDSGKYGKYTVYIAHSFGKKYKYHLNYSCSGRFLFASNIVKHNEIEPCLRCAKGHYMDTSWYNEYLRIMAIKKKYDIP